MPEDENQNPETTSQQEDESPNVRRMREQIEALQDEKSKLEGRVRLSAFKEAGLDPEQGGLNKAVYRTYEGEPDPEKIREFATEEYDWEPPNPGKSDAQKRMQAVGAAGQAPDPESTLEQADKAAQEGNWVESGALKDQELLAITQSKFG